MQLQSADALSPASRKLPGGRYPTAFAKGALDPGWKVRLPWDEDRVQMAAAAEVTAPRVSFGIF